MAKRNRGNKLNQIADTVNPQCYRETKPDKPRGNLNYWETEIYNRLAYYKNLNLLFSLAINRFRWDGLPDTCNVRYLERALLTTGKATLSHREGESSPIWTSLEVAGDGVYNMYGELTSWRAIGYDGETNYKVTPDNGVIIHYSYSRSDPWGALDMYARKLAHYEVTENNNLSKQLTPWILIAPQEKRLELENIFKQIAGGESAILGDEGLLKLVENISAIDLKVPVLVEEMGRGWQNTFNQALLMLGIPHLAFEKGERMIEDEARANTAPTAICALDCLQARRDGLREFNKLSGLDAQCYFNEDWESYNFNYTNNIEQQAQDGIIGGLE